MLGPANGVCKRGRALAAAVLHERLTNAQEKVLRRAANALDHLGRVAREVAPQYLEYAARMLQRVVTFHRAVIALLELPRRRVVSADGIAPLRRPAVVRHR